MGRPTFLDGVDPLTDALFINDFIAFSYYVDGNKAQTILSKISAVRWCHLHWAGVQVTSHPLIASTHTAVARLSGPSRPRSGLFLSTIMAGRAAAYARGAIAAAAWRGVFLSFCMLLRASEIWAYDGGKFHRDFCLRTGDVIFWRDGLPLPPHLRLGADEVRVRFRGSKSDQRRRGAVIVLKPPIGVRGQPSDPIGVLLEVFAQLPSGTTPDHPLMTVAGAGGSTRAIERTEAAREIKSLAAAEGRDPAMYHTHSPRIGAATSMSYHGIEDRLIRIAGRWRSDAYRVYIRNNVADFARFGAALVDPTPIAQHMT